MPETYLGENTWIGRLGQLLTLSAFVLAITASVFYLVAEQQRRKRAVGRATF